MDTHHNNKNFNIRMWQEHCLKCNGQDPDCDHMMDPFTIQVAEKIYEKHFKELHEITKTSFDKHKEINRYVRVLRMTPDDFSRIMDKAHFQFAKTLIHNPHHYTLMKTWDNKELWFDCCLYIHMNAQIEMFGGQAYRVYYANNGYKYWSMDPTLASTDLINRKEHDADKRV